jgi:hypothetical protein
VHGVGCTLSLSDGGGTCCMPGLCMVAELWLALLKPLDIAVQVCADGAGLATVPTSTQAAALSAALLSLYPTLLQLLASDEGAEDYLKAAMQARHLTAALIR